MWKTCPHRSLTLFSPPTKVVAVLHGAQDTLFFLTLLRRLPLALLSKLIRPRMHSKDLLYLLLGVQVWPARDDEHDEMPALQRCGAQLVQRPNSLGGTPEEPARPLP